MPWGIALKYKDTEKYNDFMSGKLTEEEICKFVNTSKELPKWISECCYRGGNKPDDVDISNLLYKAYIDNFRASGFRYYGEDYKNPSFRNRLLSYIEF